jgi:hypothetical protein
MLERAKISDIGPTAVAIADAADTRHVLMAVARLLRQQCQCKIYVYVRSNDAAIAYDSYRRDGTIDDVVMADILLRRVLDPVPNPQSVYAKAREHERFLGYTYNSLRMVRRDLGLGFYLGGFNHPVSPYARVPKIEQIANAYNHAIEFWRNEYETKKIDLHLNGAKEEAAVAQAYGVPFRFLYNARLGNRYFWAVNEMIDFDGVKKAYGEVATLDLAQEADIQQYHSDVAWRNSIILPNRWWRLSKRVWGLILRKLYHWKHRGEFLQSYYFGSNLRYLWRETLAMGQLRAPRATRLADLAGQQFVYFPLQTEPEMSLQGMSPEFFDQLWAIAMVARDLPAGVKLVVKETIYGMGRRPRDFYEQILRLKNTVLLDVQELGVEVVKVADAVVTISGTAGLEAALIGKPVIAFGQHNFYTFLPHTRVVTRSEMLKSARDWAQLESFDQRKAAADGARLKEAILRASFDLGKFSALDVTNFESHHVETAVAALLKSLRKKTDLRAAQ